MGAIFNYSFVQLPFYSQLAILLINALGVSLIITVANHLALQEKITRSFLALGLLMLSWANFSYLARLVGSNDLELSLMFLKFAWSSIPLFLSFVYIITTHITKRGHKKNTYYNFLVFSIGLGLGVITGLTDYVISGVTFKGINLFITYGKGFYIYLGFLSLIVLFSLKILSRARCVDERNRAKVDVFILGVLIFYLANLIFNVILPVFYGVTHLYSIGDYSLIIIVGFTSYAILRHNFMNTSIVATELFTIALWITLFGLTVSSRTTDAIFLNGFILTATIVLGTFLIRTVLKEVKTRETVEEMAIKLEVLNQDLQRLDSAKSDFISIASHQLRAPLSAIKGYISMIQEGTFGKLPRNLKDPLYKVYISNERLITLVSDLLDLSRMERETLQYDFFPVRLGEVTKSVINDFKIVAKSKKMKLIWIKETEEDLVKGDANKLRQILLNIIDNAFKYTPSGSVSVSLRAEGDVLKVDVKDTGPGLDKEERHVLFQKFSRGREQGRSHTEGLGLGLYVARLIADAHGGHIEVTSPGKGLGSTFSLVIPSFKPG
jgi:signal transduction histidine kinase